MNYYNFVKSILTVTTQHNLVAEFAEGDIYSIMNETNHKYPAIVLTTNTIQNDGITDIQTINGTLFYVDRLLDNQSNKLAVQSNGMTILKQIFVKLQEAYDDITIENEVFTPFYEKFSDICGGVFCTFSISYANDVICSDSEYEIRTITLTHNGLYDVTGYELAVVNVVPVWGTITGNVSAQTDLVEYIASQAPNIEAGENITIVTSGSTKIINAIDTIYDDSEVRGLISGNTQAISDEVEARTLADATLQTNIDNESTARALADAALEALIETLDDFTCGEIVPTTTNFVSGTTYSVHEALQRTANLFGGEANQISDINTKLGNCTTANTAADKAFVNSTVATNAANFRGNWSTWSNVPTDANLYPADYTGSRTPTNNDYIVVQDASGYTDTYTGQWRFMYTGDWTTLGKSGWKPQYKIGSSFTAAQQAALDSGINATKVATYDGYANSITALQTDKLDKVYSSGKKLYGVAEDGSQLMYTAGTNVQFNDDGTISATDTIYDDTALQAQVTANTAAIATKQDTLTAGDNINITGNTISAVNVITKYGEQTVEGTKIFGKETLSSPDVRLIVRWYKDSRAGTAVSNRGWEISPEIIYYKEWGGRTPAAGGTELGLFRYQTSGMDYGYPETFTFSKSLSTPGIYSYRKTDRSNTKTFTTNGNIVEFQPKLTSGTNIKTINNQILLGEGNISVQPTLVSGTNIKTINGESVLGEGNINIEVSGKVKKVSVHKAIPCSRYDITQADYVENFGGKTGNLYYKPKNSYLVLRKVSEEQYAMLDSHDGEHYYIMSAILQTNRGNKKIYTVYLDFLEYETIKNKAIIFEANTDVTLEDFLTDTDVRYSMIKDVSEASDIPCKSDFRIEKGHIICIKEPDLEIGTPASEVDAGLGYLGFCGNNRQLYIRNGYHYVNGGVQNKEFALDETYNSNSEGRRIFNYRAVLKKGFVKCGWSGSKVCYKIVSTSIKSRLQFGYNVRIYPNARKRYRSIRYFDFRCASNKYIQKRIY